jgi:hypothetical protein
VHPYHAERAPKTKPDRRVRPFDRAGSLEVIASSRHTPGHVALLDPRDGTLYCGDVYSTVGGVATSAKLNPLFPLGCSPGGECAEAALARARPVGAWARKSVESPLEAMDRAIARAS